MELAERHPGDAGRDDGGNAGVNRLTDPLVLRALAHPLRIKLLGFIGISGTLTATQAAAGLHVTPAAASYHLRILARYGFIEDAGGASWRERPWRLTDTGASFDWDDAADDPANRALSRVIYAEWFEHLQRYQAQMGRYPKDVREASGGSEFVLFASPQEVTQVWQRIREIVEPFRQRLDPAHRPHGAAPMEVLVFVHPLLPPGDTGPAADPTAPQGLETSDARTPNGLAGQARGTAIRKAGRGA
jgi:hypothetical protein